MKMRHVKDKQRHLEIWFCNFLVIHPGISNRAHRAYNANNILASATPRAAYVTLRFTADVFPRFSSISNSIC